MRSYGDGPWVLSRPISGLWLLQPLWLSVVCVCARRGVGSVWMLRGRRSSTRCSPLLLDSVTTLVGWRTQFQHMILLKITRAIIPATELRRAMQKGIEEIEPQASK